MKSGQSIDQAEERLNTLETQLEGLQLELEQQLKNMSYEYDSVKDNIVTIDIRATSTNITVHLLGLAWVPYEKGEIKDTILI
jgi:prefoldin subunit 5